MPFTAYKTTETGEKELVCVINYGRNDPPLGASRFQCPECGGVMGFRNPWVRRPHFYHLSRYGVEASCSLAAGETPEHEAGKHWVATKLAHDWRYHDRVAKVIVEYPIGNRRADVAFEMKDGGLEVFEIQLAPIAPDELKERTDDYYTAGATAVHWFIGRDADTRNNRTWIEDACGECVVIHFGTEDVAIGVGS